MSIVVGPPKNPYVENEKEFAAIECSVPEGITAANAERKIHLHRVSERANLVETLLHTYAKECDVEEQYEHRSTCLLCHRKLREDSPLDVGSSVAARAVCALDCHHMFHSLCIERMERSNSSPVMAVTCPVVTCAKPFRMFYQISTTASNFMENLSDDVVIAKLPSIYPAFDADKTFLLEMCFEGGRYRIAKHILAEYRNCARCITLGVFRAGDYSLETCRMLIDAKGDWTSPRDAALLACAAVESASRWDMEVIELFISAGVDPNAVDEHGYTILMSIAGGLDVHRCFDYPAYMAYIMRLNIDVNAINKQMDSALSLAVDRGHNGSAYASLLIKNGADVNVIGNERTTPIICRAIIDSYGDPYVVDELIEAGANVNVVGVQNDNSRVFSALGHAVTLGHVRITKSLIKAGANVNFVENNGRTALMIAARKRYVLCYCINDLIDAGAEVDAVDTNGQTALIIAVASASCESDVDAVQALVQAGASVDVVDKEGKTAIDYSSKYIKTVTTKIVESLDARPERELKRFRTGARPSLG